MESEGPAEARAATRRMRTAEDRIAVQWEAVSYCSWGGVGERGMGWAAKERIERWSFKDELPVRLEVHASSALL